MNEYKTRYDQMAFSKLKFIWSLSLPRNASFSADDFRRGRSMFYEKLWEGWIIAVHKIRERWRRMSNETRRKNVMTEFSNVYSTYSTSEIFYYKSSRRVSNLQWTHDRKMICRWNRQSNDSRDKVELAEWQDREYENVDELEIRHVELS